MANALGTRLLVRYEQGAATAAQLAAAVELGWITQEEHDAAVDPAK